MESLELRIFREVAYEQSISKAAEKMGYVQSNITSHIRSLEDELGIALFTRHSKGVTLTEEGKQLLLYADQVVGLLDSAKRQLQKATQKFKLGATQTIAAYRLPTWLSLFKQAVPSINLSVTTDTQARLLEAVAAGELDCAFVNTEFSHPKLHAAFIFSEELVVVASEKVAETDIMKQPILVANIPGCPYRNLLEKWFLQNTGKPPELIEFDTLEAILKSVSLGLGISLLPVSVLPEQHAYIAYKIKEIDTSYIQLVVRSDEGNSYLDQFIRIVQTHNL